MQKKLMLLVNPSSGRGVSKSKIGEMVTRFAMAGYAVTTHFTRAGETAEIAREYADGCQLLVCAGGDGTLSDTVSGLMHIENPPTLGYIPTGTANDMATTLALSREIPSAVETILQGYAVPLDIGCVGEHFFTYIMAFGAFTGVSYTTDQAAKRALGHFAYVISGIADIASIKPRHTIVEYDGGVIEDSFIFGGVTNTTSVAGLVRLNSRDVDLGDGRFEVILVRNPLSLQEFIDIFASISTHTYESDNVRLLHTSRVRFTFDEPVQWTRDGEDGGLHRQLEVTNRSRALRIIKKRPDELIPVEGMIWV